MKKWILLLLIIITASCSVFLKQQVQPVTYPPGLKTLEDTLYFLYTQPPAQWPKPFVDNGVVWTELGPVPESPLKDQMEQLKDKVELGKLLFFDPRISSSGKISCASCHVPSLSWTDGREKSVGHNQQLNKRNSPTLLNVWFYDKLFWDGRSHSLEDQAFGPINSEIEMHSSMGDVTRKLRKIDGYVELFKKVYGVEGITPETLTEAIAAFEKTLVSQKADFDRFLAGDTAAMSPAAIRGLHLFRTKARCMNCHNGPLLTDNSFHNLGLSNYGLGNEDLGRYMVSHDPKDVGRFRTPSLRDVMHTRPWMHNGLFNDMESIITLYNAGMPQPKPSPDQMNDPLFPQRDTLIKKLHLSKQERADIIAFLESITAPTAKFKQPKLLGLE